MLQREGSVFGSYAKGRIAEFMATGHPEWIKKSDYEAWVQKVLTPEKYAEVVERYGEAPGSYMVGEQCHSHLRHPGMMSLRLYMVQRWHHLMLIWLLTFGFRTDLKRMP